MIYLKRIGCACKHGSDFSINCHCNSDTYLVLFVKTKAEFEIGGERIITEPDTFFIFSPRSPQICRAVESTYENDWMEFESTENLSGVSGIITDKPVYIGKRVSVGDYYRLIADCHYRSGNTNAEEHLIKAMLSDIFRGEAQNTDEIPHYRELLDLRKKIYAQPNLDWTIGKMAQSASISEPYLYKIYKQAFGVTCNADLIMSRIESSQHYLLSGMTVEETAYECGYKSVVHFSRQFRQITGVSPTKWKSENTGLKL